MSIFRRQAVLAVLTAGAAAVMLAGCGSDSSGPKGPTAAQDAAHYDSLATALNAAGTSSAVFEAEGVEIFNGVIADGQKPSSVNVTYNGASATWFGNVANLVDSAGTDSVQVISLWSSTNVAEYVLVEFGNTQPDLSQAIATGGDIVDDSLMTGTGSFATPSGTCSFTAIVNVYATFPTYDPTQSTCTPESATGTMAITFQADTTATGAVHTLSFSSQTVSGVRMQFTSTAAFPLSRVPRSTPQALHFQLGH